MTELDRLKCRLEKMFSSGVRDFKPNFDRSMPVSAETLAGEINRMLDAVESGKAYQIDFGDAHRDDGRYKDVVWKPGETKRLIDGVIVYRSYGDYVDD